MLRVTRGQLTPGMRLAVPLLHPQHPNTVLLRAGYTLDESAIDRLRRMSIGDLWIYYPDAPYIAEHIDPKIMAERGALAKMMMDVFRRMGQGTHVNLDFDLYKRNIKELCRRVSHMSQAAQFMQSMSTISSESSRHATEVCYLSLLMGLKLDAYLIEQRGRLNPNRAKDVVNLALGALLHDVGLELLRQEETVRAGERIDETEEPWRRHPVRGYGAVRGHIEPSAASVVLNHHQRHDGSGFPSIDELRKLGFCKAREASGEGLPGDEPHIFARIVAVADAYDSVRCALGSHDGEEFTPAPPIRALGRVLDREWAHRFDPVALRALLKVVPAYEPGDVVRLSDGREAVIAGWNAAQPCRPPVRTLPETWRENTAEMPGTEQSSIDLNERDDIAIERVGGIDVLEDNFVLLDEGDFETQSPPVAERMFSASESAARRTAA